MFLELIHVDDKMARSFVCAEAVENGSLVKVKGFAKLSKSGVALDGETYEVEKCTDAIGDLFAIAAPDYHRYDEKVLAGDVPTLKANELFRGYLLHRGAVVRFQADVIDGTVAVGDTVSPKASSFKLTKTVTTTGSESKNIVGKVISTGSKYMGKDSVVVLFV